MMWKYVRKYIPLGVLGALFMVGEVSMGLLQPNLMSEIVDEGVIFEDVVEQPGGMFAHVEGSRALYPADSVIISISQGPRNRIVNTTKGIEVNARGLLVTDEEGRTTRPGVFASGDVVNGARTVVEAVEHSKHVAEAMDAYMRDLS